MRWSDIMKVIAGFSPLLLGSAWLVACGDPTLQTFTQPIAAQVLTPGSGDSFYEGETILVTGRISDPNPGGGASIQEVLAVATLGSVTASTHPDAEGQVTISIPTHTLVGGSRYSLQLSGSRPENPKSSVAAVAVNLLPNAPPQGELIAPKDGQRLYAGTPVGIQLLLSDAETRYTTWRLSVFINAVEVEAREVTLEPQGSDHQALASFSHVFEEGSGQELTVSLTDGYGKILMIRRPFDVGPANRPPGPCRITGPDPTVTLYESQALTLEATVSDADQPADTLSYVWQNGQTELGKGSPSQAGLISTMLPAGLPAGAHAIDLTVRDELGASCNERLSLEILPRNGAPEVEILYPAEDLGEGATLNEEQVVRIDVQARDKEDTAPLNIVLTLASQSAPIDGVSCTVLHTGQTSSGWNAFDYSCQFEATRLPVNEAVTVYVHATDSDGITVSDRLIVKILPCVDNDGDGYSSCKEPGCDEDATVHPGVEEVCDGIDNDCDKLVDSDAADRQIFYRDADGDGYGMSGQSVQACSLPVGYAARSGDCNDQDRAINPGSKEICSDGLDNNCNGEIDEADDADADGFNACVDCNDQSASIYPGAAEICDGLDSNCDGSIPNEERDHDGDGAIACRDACDSNPNAYPGNLEVCNGLDDDCDGQLPANEQDSDGDGHLDCQEPSCAQDPDRDPSQPEICNGIDDDCDGLVDEGLDRDGDGFLPCASGSTPADCDDSNAKIHPGAEEACDGIDANCDGLVDSDPRFDNDVDGVSYCMGDCDDTDPRVSSSMTEQYDGLDNDCDGELDDVLIESEASGYHTGEAQRQLLGSSMAGVGDINGDGFQDYVVGAPRYGVVVEGNSEATLSGLGRAYLFLGDGLVPGKDNDLSAASSWFTGEHEEDEAGYTVAALGDINGDGLPDFGIGARNNRNQASGSPALAGATYVFLGCRTSIEADCMRGDVGRELTPDFKIQGAEALAQAGSTLAPAGDVNGDGLMDFLVGAPEYNDVDRPDVGAVFLFLGRETADWSDLTTAQADIRFVAADSGDHLGSGLASIPGDINGDGLDDIVLGAPSSSGMGRVSVFYGSTELNHLPGRSLQVLTTEADLTIQGDASDTIGAALALADLNGDGFADLVIGAPDATVLAGSLSFPNAGRVHLVFGQEDFYGSYSIAVASLTVEGDLQPEQAGYSLAAGQDMNGDGLADLVIGAPGWSTRDWSEPSFLGRAYVLLGDQGLGAMPLLSTSDLDASFAGGTPGRSESQLATDPMNTDRVGTHVAFAGELARLSEEEPPRAELLVSAPFFDGESTDRGRTYLVVGRSLEP